MRSDTPHGTPLWGTGRKSRTEAGRQTGPEAPSLYEGLAPLNAQIKAMPPSLPEEGGERGVRILRRVRPDCVRTLKPRVLELRFGSAQADSV